MLHPHKIHIVCNFDTIPHHRHTLVTVVLLVVTKKETFVCCLHAGLLGSARFSGSSQNYSTLLLEDEAGLLYVGGRGALYALNTSDISLPGNLTVSAAHHRIIPTANKEADEQISQVFSHFPKS